ncbi:MAG: glycosyl hydrolase family protein [Chitinophagaceae bacterium]|nr:MAG: glycosyl hydrolase family protein [Chitinophagaceae bacterium]
MNPMKYTLLAIFAAASLTACKKSGGDNGPGPKPTISIQDYSMFEGTSTTPTTFNVVVKLSAAYAEAVTVNYSTGEITAKAGEDFTAISNQVLTFAPNETQKNIALSVVADDLREGEEELKIVLSSPVNATISKGTGLVIIRNDDTRISFNDNGYNPGAPVGYTLVWEDNFDGPAINPANWAFQTGDGCPNVCGWGNNELEWYTSAADNLFFQDGKMIIAALKQSYSGKEYTSSKLLSQGKKTMKFGRVDFRAKLPYGKGIWPAFWMLPENVGSGWPRTGEIDIMENVGHERSTTHGTLHFGPGPGSTQKTHSTTITGNLSDEFHVFSLIWVEDKIQWLLDGQIFATANKEDLELGTASYPFNADFFFIINLAVGGNWPGSPNAETIFPQYYIIDYIRVYQ